MTATILLFIILYAINPDLAILVGKYLIEGAIFLFVAYCLIDLFFNPKNRQRTVSK